jgi:hypothetical protein
MANLHLIEDDSGDVVDYLVFCSDSCQQDYMASSVCCYDYNGWNGCNEISTSQPCENCGDIVPGLDEE